MKLLFIISAILASTLIHAQKYEIGAMDVNGFAMKIAGVIELTDTMMFLELDTKKGVTNADFDITNERNGMTYVSDGTQTYMVQVLERKGKRKGFKHLYIMNFKHPTGEIIVYYLNPL